jgi:outer membrane protein assembly factor BamD (BamD/ComL family)
MSLADAVRKGVLAGFTIALAVGPACTRSLAADLASWQEPAPFVERESGQERIDREQDARDRMQELYDDGRAALDEGQYDKALNLFSELARKKGPRTDAALYWKAYAENQQGKRETAVATVTELKTRFPQSRWKKDAEALEIEIRNHSGQGVKPDDVANDDDLFSLAFQGLMNSDPQAGIKKAEQILGG